MQPIEQVIVTNPKLLKALAEQTQEIHKQLIGQIRYHSTDLHLPEKFNKLSLSKGADESQFESRSGRFGSQAGDTGKTDITLQFGKFTVQYENQEF